MVLLVRGINHEDFFFLAPYGGLTVSDQFSSDLASGSKAFFCGWLIYYIIDAEQRHVFIRMLYSRAANTQIQLIDQQ
jgi:hypothetical protein